MASYVTAHTVKVWGLPTELGILAGVAVGAALGAVFGYLAIRPPGHLLRDDHAGLCADGVFLLPAGAVHRRRGRHSGRAARQLFGVIDLNDTLTMFYFVLAVFLFGFGLIVRTIYSPLRPGAEAIRENEPRAISLGYDSDRYKLLAFVLSAGTVRPRRLDQGDRLPVRVADDVNWTMSGEVVLMTLLAGSAQSSARWSGPSSS